MKVLKDCVIVLFALFFTVSAVSALWCHYTPEGKEWYQDWKSQEDSAQASLSG